MNGRYDGWRCFGRGGHTWGIDQFTFSDIERSWDVLTYFYPKSILNCLFGHNRRVEEIGYYSGTPIGNVDILPIEAKDYSNYRLLVAPGFNKAMTEDIKKLKNYVTQGGTLLLGWPQMSETTDRESAVRCEHTYYGDRKPVFIEDTYCSCPVIVSRDVEYDEVLVYTDSKKPLVTVKNIGDGKVCFVNAKEYAGAKAVILPTARLLINLYPLYLQAKLYTQKTTEMCSSQSLKRMTAAVMCTLLLQIGTRKYLTVSESLF